MREFRWHERRGSFDRCEARMHTVERTTATGSQRKDLRLTVTADQSSNGDARPYSVTVMGSAATSSGRPLTLSLRELLVHLVLSGQRGLSAASFREASLDHTPADESSLRMAITRLRERLPEAAIPKAVGGRYRLALEVHEVDLWHLEQLASGGALQHLPREQLRHLLTPADPSLDSATASGDHVPNLQIALLTRVARELPSTFDASFLDMLDAHLRRHPYNEKVLFIAARTMAEFDRRAAANLISDGIRRLAEVGLPPSEDLRQLEKLLLDGEAPMTAGAPAGLRTSPAMPRPLAVHLTESLAGTEALIERAANHLMVEATTLLVEGDGGAGKSHLCARVAQRFVNEDRPVLYAACAGTGEGAFGPLMSALPGASSTVVKVNAASMDEESRRSAIWAELTVELSGALGPRGLLIIDDAEFIDSQTAHYLSRVVQSPARQWSLLVAAGRSRGSSPSWPDFERRLRQPAALHLEVGPAPVEAAQALVRELRPDFSARHVYNAASDLHRATAGRPGPMLTLAANLDGFLSSPSTGSDAFGAHLDGVVLSLPRDTREVGAAIAAARSALSLQTLARLVGLEDEDVIRAADQLITTGLAEEVDFNSFALVSVDAAAAMKRSVLGTRLRGMHQLLASLPDTDLHARAHHLSQAIPVASLSEAAAALRASGAEHCRLGNYAEAVRDYTHSHELDARPLTADHGAWFSRALDLTGSVDRANRMREEIVSRLLRDEAADDALAVAISGLPESERLHGEPEVVAMLNAIADHELSSWSEWTLRRTRARQLALAGCREDASDDALEVERLADTDEQRFVGVTLSRWLVSDAPPEQRLELMRRAETLRLTPAADAERLVLLAVDSYEQGELMSASTHLEHLDALPQLPAIRRWHRALFAATFASDQGRLVEAARLRAEAYQLGMAIGAAEADSAYAGAEFTLRLLMGGAGEAPRSATGAMSNHLLVKAAAALLAAHVGEMPEALAISEAIARDVLARSVSGGLAALALTGTVLATSRDRALVNEVAGLLETRRRSMLLVGAGAVSLGPVARYLPPFVRGTRARVGLLEEATQFADRAGALFWSALCRRDQLGLAPGRRVAGELAHLVGDTELEWMYSAGS